VAHRGAHGTHGGTHLVIFGDQTPADSIESGFQLRVVRAQQVTHGAEVRDRLLDHRRFEALLPRDRLVHFLERFGEGVVGELGRKVDPFL
jgi:hypothetical protein